MLLPFTTAPRVCTMLGCRSLTMILISSLMRDRSADLLLDLSCDLELVFALPFKSHCPDLCDAVPEVAGDAWDDGDGSAARPRSFDKVSSLELPPMPGGKDTILFGGGFGSSASSALEVS